MKLQPAAVSQMAKFSSKNEGIANLSLDKGCSKLTGCSFRFNRQIREQYLIELLLKRVPVLHSFCVFLKVRSDEVLLDVELQRPTHILGRHEAAGVLAAPGSYRTHLYS